MKSATYATKTRPPCEMLLKSATPATKTSAHLLGAADGGIIAAAVPILQPKPSREQEMKLTSTASCEMLLKSATTATKTNAHWPQGAGNEAGFDSIL